MLCPQCEQPAPGGSLCPVCGAQVPDRETFEGQGTHYFLVLAAITLLLVAGSLIWVHYTVGVGPWLRSMLHEPWPGRLLLVDFARRRGLDQRRGHLAQLSLGR